MAVGLVLLAGGAHFFGVITCMEYLNDEGKLLHGTRAATPALVGEWQPLP